MAEPKHIIAGGGAALVVAIAAFAIYRSASASTTSGATEQARQLVQHRNTTDAIPADKYKLLMSKARGFKSK